MTNSNNTVTVVNSFTLWWMFRWGNPHLKMIILQWHWLI